MNYFSVFYLFIKLTERLLLTSLGKRISHPEKQLWKIYKPDRNTSTDSHPARWIIGAATQINTCELRFIKRVFPVLLGKQEESIHRIIQEEAEEYPDDSLQTSSFYYFNTGIFHNKLIIYSETGILSFFHQQPCIRYKKKRYVHHHRIYFPIVEVR